ncbi:hypothetical protein BESB_048590 [Besnoitia besnoiti]|uniref:Uncharacterized protein n=1 Tax=Besnoitia besnoiti TaxID=94643 RepID=A0A2A9MLU3_BESBE|nr:hypothetical protein BESB_048590 [Besnoitia besnoiti]PFH36667.1 hypothetical protein BESB_048590 [Besnoitia besnoiti]
MTKKIISASVKKVLTKLLPQKKLPQAEIQPPLQAPDASVEESPLSPTVAGPPNDIAGSKDCTSGPGHSQSREHAPGIDSPPMDTESSPCPLETSEEPKCFSGEQSSMDAKDFVSDLPAQSIPVSSQRERDRERSARLQLDPILLSFAVYPAVLTFTDREESIADSESPTTDAPESPYTLYATTRDLTSGSGLSIRRANPRGNPRGCGELTHEMEVFQSDDSEGEIPCLEYDSSIGSLRQSPHAFAFSVGPMDGRERLPMACASGPASFFQRSSRNNNAEASGTEGFYEKRVFHVEPHHGKRCIMYMGYGDDNSAGH